MAHIKKKPRAADSIESRICNRLIAISAFAKLAFLNPVSGNQCRYPRNELQPEFVQSSRQKIRNYPRKPCVLGAYWENGRQS